jgi:hypothetical protein
LPPLYRLQLCHVGNPLERGRLFYAALLEVNAIRDLRRLYSKIRFAEKAARHQRLARRVQTAVQPINRAAVDRGGPAAARRSVAFGAPSPGWPRRQRASSWRRGGRRRGRQRADVGPPAPLRPHAHPRPPAGNGSLTCATHQAGSSCGACAASRQYQSRVGRGSALSPSQAG